MSKKKTKKCTRLCRSQRAHKSLERKYSQLGGINAQIKEYYHGSMRVEQEFRGRVLNSKEKARVYDQARKHITHTW